MPAIRLGRVVRFEREPLLRWLARKQPRAARRLTTRRRTPQHNRAATLSRTREDNPCLAPKLALRDHALPAPAGGAGDDEP